MICHNVELWHRGTDDPPNHVSDMSLETHARRIYGLPPNHVSDMSQPLQKAFQDGFPPNHVSDMSL